MSAASTAELRTTNPAIVDAWSVFLLLLLLLEDKESVECVKLLSEVVVVVVVLWVSLVLVVGVNFVSINGDVSDVLLSMILL